MVTKEELRPGMGVRNLASRKVGVIRADERDPNAVMYSASFCVPVRTRLPNGKPSYPTWRVANLAIVMIQLTRRVGRHPSVEGIGICNYWVFRSLEGYRCTFPDDDRLHVLGNQHFLGSTELVQLVEIGTRGENNIGLYIRIGVPKASLDAFTDALASETAFN